LLSEPLRASCTGLADVMFDISHDSVNRFLIREDYSPEDLRTEIEDKIDVKQGTILPQHVKQFFLNSYSHNL